jgi:hypothetical protein
MADAQQLRLGLTKQILPFTREQVLLADYKFNKFLINTAQNALKGLVLGTVASVFFKSKGIIFYSAGFGIGYTGFSTFAV